ncbi:MAG: HD domain-containing protein [Burkholderiales bacterium]
MGNQERKNKSNMTERRNNYDVTNRIKITDPVAVNREVDRIFTRLYPTASTRTLDRAFKDLARLHHGMYPGYQACDVGYHNLQHTLDVTLAMARLMDGHERSPDGAEALGAKLFILGILTALFHDIGYLRRSKDMRHKSGAAYTRVHVTRGTRFLKTYMGKLGLAELASAAARIMHFTGYERPVDSIRLADARLRMLGSLLGTADIIAQMSDRCYLEKCRDGLYQEFVEGGLAARDKDDKRRNLRYRSAADLVAKTPGFFVSAMERLNRHLGSVYRFAATHFKGRNLYLEIIQRNIQFAAKVARNGKLSLLRRAPPRDLKSGSRKT